MSLDLVHPAPNPSPESALHVSQQAPHLLASSGSLPWPLSILSANDTQDKWTTVENLYISCLRTGDDKSAKLLLEQLVERFGDKNERVMAYQGMWAEAKVENEKDMIEVLKEYGEALEEDPANVAIQKRRIALLRSMGRIPEATTQLVDLVTVSPTDAEAWAELSDVYLSQGLYEQAIFAMEEVLLVMPNAWNMHARLAEIIYRSVAANSSNRSAVETARGYAESMRRYCRSIELCGDYLRGYYGLKLSSNRLLDILPTVGKKSDGESAYSDLPLPSLKTVEKLNEVATAKLAEVVRKSSSGEKGWNGFDKAEVIAARELLDNDRSSAPR